VKELDELLTEAFKRHPPAPKDLPLWERLLAQENGALYRWLVEGKPCPDPDLKGLIEEIGVPPGRSRSLRVAPTPSGSFS